MAKAESPPKHLIYDVLIAKAESPPKHLIYDVLIAKAGH
jgi:hypothetical protein